jgi:hypothetical protein
VLDGEITEFLHSGCALLVGTVDATGQPHAGRGLGLTVLDARAGRVRLLADADDAPTIANLQPGALVAITAASVRTLRSFQMKGHVVLVEPADEADASKQAQYTDDFIRDIHETDGEPLELLRRWTDHPSVACVVDVDSSFDQTPGPSAGSQLRRRAS